jgi:hypothetical protein
MSSAAKAEGGDVPTAAKRTVADIGVTLIERLSEIIHPFVPVFEYSIRS